MKQNHNLLAVTLVAFFLLFGFKTHAQQPRVVKWNDMEELLARRTDTTYIVNFWATWCKPCVAEVPSFKKIAQNYATQKVRVVLVSLDFAKDFKTRVVPFAEKADIENLVVLLNEPDANAWINKIDPRWSGAVPATLVFNNRSRKRTFAEAQLTFDDLVQKIFEVSR